MCEGGGVGGGSGARGRGLTMTGRYRNRVRVTIYCSNPLTCCLLQPGFCYHTHHNIASVLRLSWPYV